MKNAVVKAALQCGADCPAPEALARAMELPSGAGERQTAEGHLKHCAPCRTEFALLQEFERGQERADETAAVDWIVDRLDSSSRPTNSKGKVIEIRPKWWQTFWMSPGRMSALAVAAVLIFAVVLTLPRRQSETTGEGTADVLRSAPLHAIAPSGDLIAPPTEFRWNTVQAATNYVVTVTEVDRTVVFQGKVTTTSLPVPPQLTKLLQPGKTLLWTVRAEDAAGHELTTSGEQRFRVASSPPN